jgi:hypothetical protein
MVWSDAKEDIMDLPADTTDKVVNGQIVSRAHD